jgi:hypothetical protein
MAAMCSQSGSMVAAIFQGFSGVDLSGVEYAFDLVYDNGNPSGAADDELKIMMKARSMNLNAIYLADGDVQAWEIEGSDPFAKVMRKLPIQDGNEKAPRLGGRIKFDQPLKADRLSPALNMNGSGVSWDSLLVLILVWLVLSPCRQERRWCSMSSCFRVFAKTWLH